MKVGIVLGSVRDGRAGEAVANWVAKGAAGREATYELIDLKAFDVPLLTTNTHPMRAKKSYDDERVQAWSDAIDACDAYIFVTPEYNHGVPGALKNAVDSLGQEWVGKTAALVGYGSVGGVRAIENWRLRRGGRISRMWDRGRRVSRKSAKASNIVRRGLVA